MPTKPEAALGYLLAAFVCWQLALSIGLIYLRRTTVTKEQLEAKGEEINQAITDETAQVQERMATKVQEAVAAALQGVVTQEQADAAASAAADAARDEAGTMMDNIKTKIGSIIE
jgi:hypothetical protein